MRASRKIEKMETDGTIKINVPAGASMIRREAARQLKFFLTHPVIWKAPAVMFSSWTSSANTTPSAEARPAAIIPVVAFGGHKLRPELVTYPIPGNDDAIRAVRVVLGPNYRQQ